MCRISTLAILVFGFSLILYYGQLSQALTVQNKDKNAKGQQLYMTYCASCHGVDGKGDGPAAVALKTSLPNLTMIAPEHGKFPALRIRRVINGDDVIPGHGSREMPVWGDYFTRKRDAPLSRLNVYALMKYLEAIQAQ